MTDDLQPGRTDQGKPPSLPDELRAVFIYGRLHGLPRARIAAILVNRTRRLVRDPERASTIVLAHAAALGLTRDGVLALPFPVAQEVSLLSEDAFKHRLDGGTGDRPSRRSWAHPRTSASLCMEEEPDPAAWPAGSGLAASGPYGLDDVARLSGLPVGACRALALFDVLAPAGGALAYVDLMTARQARHLLAQGITLPAIIAAAAVLGRRGLRMSQVRLAPSPWGGIVQRVGEKIAQLDGQFALVLDEDLRDAEECFARARAAEAGSDLAEAERWYLSAAHLDKTDPVAPFNLGNVLVARGRAPEAMIAFRRALDRDRAFAEAAFNLARLQEEVGQADTALAGYRSTITAHPAYAQAIYNAARLLARMGRYDEAAPLWDRFIALVPADPDIGHARRAALLCRLGLPRT